MSVREYVGARYVPLFATPLEWSNAGSYEPLTIVQHEGNSYTSRQFVPVGIDISNEDYWALTGNYNAQIEQYRQEVSAYDGRITANSNAIADNTAKIAENTASISANEAEIAHLNEKKVAVVIGDSYSDVDKNTSLTYWHEMVCQQLDLTDKCYALDSCGYISGSKTFSQQLDEANSDGSFDNEDVKYVFVYGGRNDVTKTLTQTSVDDVISKAKGYFQNAQVVVIGVNTWQGMTYNASSTNDVYTTNTLQNACWKAGVTFMSSLWWLVGKGSYFDSAAANAHPNQSGQNYIAARVLQTMFGGMEHPSFSSAFNFAVTASEGTAAGSIQELEGRIHCYLTLKVSSAAKRNITLKSTAIPIAMFLRQGHAFPTSNSSVAFVNTVNGDWELELTVPANETIIAMGGMI